MGTNSGPFSAIDGLIYCLDPANPKSYPGTGTGVTELSRVSANPTLNSGVAYYANPKGYFEFDGVNDNIPFTLTNFGTTTTVEIWMKMKAFSGGMPFGFLLHDIWTGGGSGGTLGFNSAAGDSYGLTSAQVTNLGLLNQWKHYVFEMRSDVSYTNNKIYINASSQTLSQVGGTENAGNRNFNSGNGRISCWLNDNGYHQPMDIALFRVYNRALSSGEILQNYNALSKRFNYLENLVSNGLVLYLDLGNYSSYRGTGTSITDLSGIGNTGTLINGPVFSSANAGILSFDGSNDYIQFPAKVTPSASTPFTASVWCRRNINNTVEELLSEWTFATTSNAFFLGFDGTLVRFSDNWLGINISGAGTTNVWMNIVAINTVSNAYIYFNGTLAATKGSGFTYTGSGPLTIGRQGEFTEFFNGNIAQVQIYNRALSATEVQQNYNALKQRYGLS